MFSKINFLMSWLDYEKYADNYFTLLAFLLCGLLTLYFLSKAKRNLPPGPIGLPLLGYLPFLGKEPFKTLDKLRWKYGNVFSLYLGRTYTVVLGDYTAVKEAFSQSSMNNRPDGIFDFIPDGGGVSAANGEEWVEQRRLVLRTMRDIGLQRSSWARMVEEDTLDFVKLVSSQNGHPIDMEKILKYSLNDSLASLLFGRRLPEERDKELTVSATSTVVQFFSPFNLWNFFPKLCNLLVALKITSYYKDYCEMEAFNTIVRREVELHRRSQERSEMSDFISLYMDGIREKGGEASTNDRNIVGSSRALFVGGIDTTTTSLLWLFLIMAAYPEVQEKVHSELDSVLGKDKRATWEDHSTLPYTYAVIMEAQRWKTIAPINVPRMTSRDIKVCGYAIPKGTTILANNWGIHNDTRYWKEPEKFIPERFLQNGVNEAAKKESFVPFSYGKRKCIGENVAVIGIFLYFTATMQSFQVSVPGGGKPNMEPIYGITYSPISKKLCFVSRK